MIERDILLQNSSLSSGYHTRLDALLAVLSRWRSSMFWTMLPTMFLASCTYAAILSTFGTFQEDDRLRKVLAPIMVNQDVQQVMRPMHLPKDYEAFERWCIESLPILTERILATRIADRAGDDNVNGFYQAKKSGRLAVSLHRSDGSSCDFPREVAVLPELQQKMSSPVFHAGDSPSGSIVEHKDGWTSVTSVKIGDDGDVLTVGMLILSPFAKLVHPRSVFKNIAIFVANISVMTALVFLALFLRRIKRAFRAAEAWTSGDLSMRIGDHGRDEFSRLTQKFDDMADSLSGVIIVKQALAAAEERNRLARDLHDSAKQRAFALNLQLSAAHKLVPSDTREGKLIDAALNLTNQLQQDLSEVIQRLAAPTIVESGFRHTLTDSIQRMLMGSSIRLVVELAKDDETMFNAAPTIASQLLLISSEAVANVLKHARSERCSIIGQRSGQRYTWTISDDGVGFEPSDSSREGMGLENMKTRAQNLPEGSLTIRSAPSSGTDICVSFRLDKQINYGSDDFISR